MTNNIKSLANKLSTFSIVALAFSMLFTACKPEDSTLSGNFEKGILILNEGNFGSGNSDVTHHINNTTQQNIFNLSNNRPLGDVGQSMAYYDGKYYIVVNNSDKIEVVDMNFKSVTAFEGIIQPRYMEFINGKAYVSSWGNGGQVYVIEPATGAILKIIPTDLGSEKMLCHDGYIYVANCGGWATGNTISIINTATDDIELTVEVGTNPTDIILDDQNNIWILLAGQYAANWLDVTDAGLVKFNPQTNEIIATIPFNISTGQANSLCSKGGLLYYIYNGGINEIATDATEAPTTPIILGNFYKLHINNTTFYACDAGNFTEQGNVFVFNAGSETATDTIPTGIGPSYILFRN